MKWTASIIVVLLSGATGLGLADDRQGDPKADPAPDDRVGALEKKIVELQRAYDARITALEAEITRLKGTLETAPEAPPQAPAEAPSQAPPALAGAAPSQT